MKILEEIYKHGDFEMFSDGEEIVLGFRFFRPYKIRSHKFQITLSVDPEETLNDTLKKLVVLINNYNDWE